MASCSSSCLVRPLQQSLAYSLLTYSKISNGSASEAPKTAEQRTTGGAGTKTAQNQPHCQMFPPLLKQTACCFSLWEPLTDFVIALLSTIIITSDSVDDFVSWIVCRSLV